MNRASATDAPSGLPPDELAAINLSLARVIDQSLKKIERLRDGRDIVLAPLFGREYIGNVSEQAHYLRYLFGDGHQIFLLSSLLQSQQNHAFRDVATRGCYNLNIDLAARELFDVINFNFPKGVVIRGAGWILVPSFRISLLRERYAEAAVVGGPRATTHLSDEEEDQGRALVRRLGIPDGSPIVVLHVREAGYHSGMQDFDFRNHDVATYLPAIRWLVAQGFVVVRIGDRSMRALPAMGPSVVDAPHHPAYIPLLDPYMIAKCAFMIGTSSGPMDLARAFGKPQLTTNGYICDYFFLERNYAVLPRALVDVENGAPRPLKWIYDTSLSRMVRNGDLRRRRVRAEPCRPEDILAAVQEFADRHVLGRRPPSDDANPLQDYCRKEDAARKASGSSLPEERFCSFASPGARLSRVFLERYPAFTRGEPLPIAERRVDVPIGLGLSPID
jgi:putative glycosyltransferase (TIGR04372 family)